MSYVPREYNFIQTRIKGTINLINLIIDAKYLPLFLLDYSKYGFALFA
jgi:hypothetical protein